MGDYGRFVANSFANINVARRFDCYAYKLALLKNGVNPNAVT